MTVIDDQLRAYLAAYPAHHQTHESWPVQGRMEVRLALADRLPPAHVSSSILAIVLDANLRVLYLWPDRRSGSIAHLLIGGRPRDGETPEETAIREVGEETGWRIKPTRLIGFRHFVQLEPWSAESDRPYPDFVQPIYAAHALEFRPDCVVTEDCIPAEFLDLPSGERSINPPQRPLLHAAVNEMRRRAVPAL